jgi:glycosyltransferase involved in cell wall biosynthesis
MAAMEGLVMGLPVVAPNYGPFPYLVENLVNGILYEPDSVESLKDSILMCLENKDVYAEIRIGAAQSGRKFLDAPTRFAEAIQMAFANRLK